MKLSIRDMLLLTVIVALTLGWWLDRASLRSQLKAVQLESAKWKVEAEVYAKLLRELPPTGFDYPSSIVPFPKPPNSSVASPSSSP